MAALWVPKLLNKPSPRVYLSTFIDYEAVFGQTPSIAAVIALLKGIRREDCLRVLCSLCMLLANENERDRKIQESLTGDFLAPPTKHRLWVEADRTGSEIAFAERSVLCVLQLAAVHCDPAAPALESEPANAERIARACFAMNHLYLPVLRPARSELGPGARKERVHKLLVQDLWFRRFERFSHAFPRYWELLYGKPLKEGVVHFAGRFAEATGLSFEQHAAAALAFQTFYQDFGIEKAHEDPTSFNPLIDFQQLFSETHLDPAIRARIECEYTQNVTDLADELSRAFEDGYDPFALELARRPFLRLDSGRVICSSPTLLWERLTAGQYWQILDGFAGDSSGEAFLRGLGDRFEEYVRRLCSRVVGPGRCHHVEDEGELADAILEYPKSLVLIQVKSGRPREQVIREGELEAFLCELRSKSVLRAAEQSVRAVRRLFSEGISIGGRGAHSLTAIYPVVVLLVPLQLDELLWRELDKEPEIRSLSNLEKVRPLQVVCAEELEMMETVCSERGLDLPTLLERKVEWDRRGRAWMKNFLIEEFSPVPANQYLRAKAEEILETVVKPLLWG